MSELINTNTNRATIRKHFLTTASAAALMAYVAAAMPARAEDPDRPTVWIELGGQLEMLQGTSSPFVAPFMTLTPTPAPFNEAPPIESQQPKNTAWGLEGSLDFQPKDSDWTFSAGIRYGRSRTKRHVHQQSAVPDLVFQYTLYQQYTGTRVFPFQQFADTKLLASESHLLLDFMAGKDVGLGSFGKSGRSTISAGVRFAQFSSKARVDSYARPTVGYKFVPLPAFPQVLLPASYFHAYTMHANAERSFHGIGPSVSWKASATLLGNDHVHLDADWGVNGALLFGRQKAKTSHSTHAYYQTGVQYTPRNYVEAYPTRMSHSTRSRSVIVPNIGGFAGLSVNYPNAKVSLGYRADFFFGAMDTGIDYRQSKDVGFHGPFATISIGLGG